MSKHPLVSVVIPSYNHRQFVVQALRSVLQQDYRPLEIVVIDDGSSDGSPALLKRFINSAAQPGIRFQFIARENQGAPATLNEAIRLCHGDWITILNSDDYFFPQRISKMLALARSSKSEFVFSLVQHVDQKGKTLSDYDSARSWYIAQLRKQPPTMGFHFLYSNIAITTGNFLFTRKLFENLEGFRNYVLIHDYDFVLRALSYTEPAFLNEPLLAYRVHGTNTIQSKSYLAVAEGPKVAADFMLNALLKPKPLNESAPWSVKNRVPFAQYWTENAGSIQRWLGGQNLAALV